jgi:hypothetical protein
MERDNAILRALKYLIPSERVHKVVADLPAGEREALLCLVARERDPRLSDFMAAFDEARRILAETEEHAMVELASQAGKVEAAVADFANSLGRMRIEDGKQNEELERLRRTAGGLAKELSGLGDLVDNRQFHRLARRLEQLVESREEIERASRALAGAREGLGASFEAILAVIDEVEQDRTLERIREIEERLLSVQVTMLGRRVHSHEHWQYLRELAFKYPVSPLVCCVAKINDRWMVVPIWASPVADVLRTGRVED